MTKKMVSLTASVLALGLFSQTANAQLQGYESFSYTSGTTLTGISPGSGLFPNNWTTKTPGTTSAVGSSGLGYTDGSGNTLSTTGNSGVSVGSSATDNPQLVFGSTLGVASGATATAGSGTIWISYLWQGLNTSAAGSLFRQATFGLYSGMTTSSGSGNEYLDIGMPNIQSSTVGTVNPNISLWYGGKGLAGQTSSSTAPAINSSAAANGGNTLMIVLQLQMDNSTTTADTLNMWINPTLGGAGPTGTEYTYSLQDLTSINGIRMASGNTNATFGLQPGMQQYDEFRVGDTFADVSPIVTPEPTVMALAGLGGATLLAFRRRRA